MRWVDVDLDARTVSISGHIVRVKGEELPRADSTKIGSNRLLHVPKPAADMLLARHMNAPRATHDVVFPSSAETLRDGGNVSKQWRILHAELGFDWITAHTFRRTVATLIDNDGLSSRLAADQLGHASPSMTQDVYMGRGQVHPEASAALETVNFKNGSAG